VLIGPRHALRVADHPRLDLDEHERAFVANDQIDLATTRAYVTRDHHIADPAQMSRRELLATSTERSPPLIDCSRTGARRIVDRDHLRQARSGLGGLSTATARSVRPEYACVSVATQ
jgi:hypothetical protein